ncbi:hypothetical protein ACQEVF_59325 [Nonomuraea polychroma]|uniref:hypothetical protein n=1 Tax=Nonomuraea polychroma TaxID=46176 RepID=UPI003D94D42F
MAICLHCRRPAQECAAAQIRNTAIDAARQTSFAELVASTEEDLALRVEAAWDAALVVNDLVDLLVADSPGTSAEEAHGLACALIEEAACA